MKHNLIAQSAKMLIDFKPPKNNTHSMLLSAYWTVFVVTDARVILPPQTIKSSETKIYAEVKTQKWIKEKKEAEVKK